MSVQGSLWIESGTVHVQVAQWGWKGHCVDTGGTVRVQMTMWVCKAQCGCTRGRVSVQVALCGYPGMVPKCQPQCPREAQPCPRGWWGHPTCGPCSCDVTHGFDPDCNKTTGECRCKVGPASPCHLPCQPRHPPVTPLLPPVTSLSSPIMPLTPLQSPPCHPLSPHPRACSDPVSLQDNHYRPPGGDTCHPCECYPTGSLSRRCDATTGQCPCKAGVIGRHCDRCDNPFAEVTASGCEGGGLSTRVTLCYPECPPSPCCHPPLLSVTLRHPVSPCVTMSASDQVLLSPAVTLSPCITPLSHCVTLCHPTVTLCHTAVTLLSSCVTLHHPVPS